MTSPSHASPDLQPPAYLQTLQPDADPFPEPSFSIPSLRLPLPVVAPHPPSGSISTLRAQRDPLQQLHNQTVRLTNELQQLIDAQAGALLGNNDSSSAPPLYPRSGSSMKPRMSLSDARNGLLTAMGELVDVKGREAMVYGDLAAERRELAEFIRINTKKTTQLREEISTIQACPEAVRAEQLREERATIGVEIDELQRRLRGLELKHQSLGREIDEMDNVVQSRAASYEGSLNSLTKRTSAFLAKYHQLNPEIALKTWTAGEEACTRQMEAAAREKEALESGIALWQDCLSIVRRYESMMRDKVRSKTLDDAEVRKDLLSSLERVIVELEEMVSVAEKSRWKLLQACIGSELQALHAASAILRRGVLES